MTKAAAALMLALLSACASTPLNSPPAAGDPQRYQASATVLEAPDTDPMLCLGAVDESLPPQCGGPVIVNWDWATVDGETSANGTTWGEYHVIGTFEDNQFTLTEPAGPFRSIEAPANMFDSPCDPPLAPTDPSKADGESQTKAIDLARSRQDFAGVWVDGPILNMKFTGDLDRHEREIRQIWGGPLCVSKAERTMNELQSIQRDLTRDAKAFDLEMLSAGVDEVANVVDLQVVVMHDDTQDRIDARFGKGVVRVTGRLEPVD